MFVYLLCHRVHPLNVLLAQKTYEKGRGEKSKKTQWKPNPAIVEALNVAFCNAFKVSEDF